MNQDFVIVSDATVDLPQSIIEELDLSIIPMSFRMSEQDYLYHPDEKAISCKEFYSRLSAGEDSKTTQINPIVYQKHFRKFLEEGKDVLYLAFSSGLSGTFNTAHIAVQDLLEEFPERKIICIDTLCASIGEGLLVSYAGKLRKEGKTLGEVCDFVYENKTRVCHWFTVDDLLHLKRGGRLSTLEAAVGTALKIKPVLSLDREGKLTVVAKVRGTRRAIDYLRDRLLTDGDKSQLQTVIIGHGNAIDTAEQIKELLLSEGLVKEAIISNIGPIIGTHTGAGMFALTFMGDNYKF